MIEIDPKKDLIEENKNLANQVDVLKMAKRNGVILFAVFALIYSAFVWLSYVCSSQTESFQIDCFVPMISFITLIFAFFTLIKKSFFKKYGLKCSIISAFFLTSKKIKEIKIQIKRNEKEIEKCDGSIIRII
jgi:hypothetical protein